MKVQKIGNSYMVTIPKKIAEAMHVKDGDEVEIEFNSEKSQVVTYKIAAKNSESIKDLEGLFKSSKKLTQKQVEEWMKEESYE